MCNDEDIFNIIIQIFDVLDEKYKIIDGLLDDILNAIENKDIGELIDILRELIDELVYLLNNDGCIMEELDQSLRTIAWIYNIKVDDDLESLLEELSQYEIFMERIRRRFEVIRDVLRAKREQMENGLKGF
ncbi:MAG: hypothetical protein QXK45_05680 [Thermofilaceae archaeon]